MCDGLVTAEQAVEVSLALDRESAPEKAPVNHSLQTLQVVELKKRIKALEAKNLVLTEVTQNILEVENEVKEQLQKRQEGYERQKKDLIEKQQQIDDKCDQQREREEASSIEDKKREEEITQLRGEVAVLKSNLTNSIDERSEAEQVIFKLTEYTTVLQNRIKMMDDYVATSEAQREMEIEEERLRGREMKIEENRTREIEVQEDNIRKIEIEKKKKSAERKLENGNKSEKEDGDAIDEDPGPMMIPLSAEFLQLDEEIEIVIEEDDRHDVACKQQMVKLMASKGSREEEEEAESGSEGSVTSFQEHNRAVHGIEFKVSHDSTVADEERRQHFLSLALGVDHRISSAAHLVAVADEVGERRAFKGGVEPKEERGSYSLLPDSRVYSPATIKSPSQRTPPNGIPITDTECDGGFGVNVDARHHNGSFNQSDRYSNGLDDRNSHSRDIPHPHTKRNGVGSYSSGKPGNNADEGKYLESKRLKAASHSQRIIDSDVAHNSIDTECFGAVKLPSTNTDRSRGTLRGFSNGRATDLAIEYPVKSISGQSVGSRDLGSSCISEAGSRIDLNNVSHENISAIKTSSIIEESTFERDTEREQVPPNNFFKAADVPVVTCMLRMQYGHLLDTPKQSINSNTAMRGTDTGDSLDKWGRPYGYSGQKELDIIKKQLRDHLLSLQGLSHELGGPFLHHKTPSNLIETEFFGNEYGTPSAEGYPYSMPSSRNRSYAPLPQSHSHSHSQLVTGSTPSNVTEIIPVPVLHPSSSSSAISASSPSVSSVCPFEALKIQVRSQLECISRMGLHTSVESNSSHTNGQQQHQQQPHHINIGTHDGLYSDTRHDEVIGERSTTTTDHPYDRNVRSVQEELMVCLSYLK